MMRSLKPCWWCGEQFTFMVSGSPTEYQVKCIECGATGPMRKTYKKARRAWNKGPK